MKANYHTHTTWCDGKNTAREIIEKAIDLGFETIGFSSHAMLPQNDIDWVLTPEKVPLYAAEIRSLAAEFAGKIRVLCAVEADYIPGSAEPSYAAYKALKPDYIIGSVHFVRAGDGAIVEVDHSPEILLSGINAHFQGNVESFVRAYFEAVRNSLSYDFDIVGHPDLVRKFNLKHPYFDESAQWYRKEVELTADAIALSGKIVEVNTGAISRGWLDSVYPSDCFRSLLRARNVKFILNSDAHSVDGIDCSFDKFASLERYVTI